ncbi:MAG: Crp/Fnr family transcriptional regulator, partial [Clostridia bacterium]|nr:Crp/Fnr family transcriptional regulator [Clostridia bacterium]
MSLHAFYEHYFPFWNKLAEADKQLLCENTAEKHFDRSQPVHDNMGCTGLFIVCSGRLRLYMLS